MPGISCHTWDYCTIPYLPIMSTQGVAPQHLELPYPGSQDHSLPQAHWMSLLYIYIYVCIYIYMYMLYTALIHLCIHWHTNVNINHTRSGPLHQVPDSQGRQPGTYEDEDLPWELLLVPSAGQEEGQGPLHHTMPCSIMKYDYCKMGPTCHDMKRNLII